MSWKLTSLQKQAAIRFPGIKEIKNVYQALMNYLQLPSGSGEGLSFDFDMNDFVKSLN